MTSSRAAEVAVLGVLIAGADARGQWVEIGDAGDIVHTSVQATAGTGPLRTITGATHAGELVDAYCITITDPASFYATTDVVIDAAAFAVFDTRLWLFDAAGNVVLGNDDTSDRLQSTISDPSSFNALTGEAVNATASGVSLTPGLYILVISGYDMDAVDSFGDEIITLDNDFTELHGPNVGPGPLDDWDGIDAAFGEYTIALNGAGFCVPTSGVLGPPGLLGVVASRRRRSVTRAAVRGSGGSITHHSPSR